MPAQLRSTARGPAARIALAVACALVGAWMWQSFGDQDRVRRGNDLALAGRFAEAVREARAVQRRPAALRARVLEAKALYLEQRFAESERAYRKAAALSPSDWRLRREWATVLLQTGNRRGAQRQMARALALNPRQRLPAGFVPRAR